MKVDLSPIHQLRETDSVDVENLRKLCLNISNIAQGLYRPHHTIKKHKERDAETLEEFVGLTCEMLYQAQENIYALSKTPRLPSVSQFWSVLSDRMANGVKYTRLVDINEIIDHGLATKERDISEYPIDLYVLENEKIKDKLYIVDDRLMSICHRLEERKNNKIGFGRITNHYYIISRKKQQYLQYISSAIPARFVLDYMQNIAEILMNNACNILDNEQLEWLNDLIKYGRFSQYHKKQNWSPDQFKKIKTEMMQKGFIIYNDFGDIIPSYNISEIMLREAYTIFQHKNN